MVQLMLVPAPAEAGLQDSADLVASAAKAVKVTLAGLLPMSVPPSFALTA